MTMTAAPATSSDYYITVPISACVSLTLTDLPSGLSREEILARLTVDALWEQGELSYPMKKREEVHDARYTIENNSDDIDIEEDVYEDGQAKTT